MSFLRVFTGSAVVACLVVLGVLLWSDWRTPVNIVVSPLEQGSIRVSVTGAVATPGVLTLEPDARLADAAAAAGGFTFDADVSGLNLAGRVGDGEHIVVPRETAANPDATVAGEATGPQPLDLNRATAEELEALPGIGEVLAARIVGHRETHGPFTSVDDLAGIDGISAAVLEEIRPLVTVGDGS